MQFRARLPIPAAIFGRRILIAAALGLAAMAGAHAQPAAGDWPSYGRDPGAQHYSPLVQITLRNVAGLKVAWTRHMLAGLPPPAGGRGRAISSETTPLVIDGILYLGRAGIFCHRMTRRVGRWP